jgi:hypothetical protein
MNTIDSFVYKVCIWPFTSTKNNFKFTLEQLIFETRKDHAVMSKYNEERKAALAAGLPPPPFPQG